MSLKRRLFRLLPNRVKEAVFKRALSPPDDEFLRDIEIKVASQPDEVLAAYELVYESYFQSGLCTFEEDSLRVTKHALLPTTSMIVVKYKGKVVGSISLIMDSPMGLPLESLWNIEFLRDKGKRIAEISTLTVMKGFRRKRGLFILPLMIYLYRYAVEYLGTDYFVIATHPDAAPFYSGLFNFKAIDRKVRKYNGVEGALAFGQYGDMSSKEVTEFAKKAIIGKGKDAVSVYSLLEIEKTSCFQYPERNYFRAFDPSFNLELLKQVFKKDLQSLKTIDSWEKEILGSLYAFSEFKDIFSGGEQEKYPQFDVQRESPRFWVNCPGTLVDLEQGRLSPIRVFNLSRQGIQFSIVGETLPVGFSGQISCLVGPQKEVRLNIMVVRTKGPVCGAKVMSATPAKTWTDLNNYLESVILKENLSRKEFEDAYQKFVAS